MLNFSEIEKKWQKEWEENKIFESEPNEKEPYMVTAAFPYVNSPLHIGHVRTYGIADILARYKRMRGYNVLFPMGFHATGTPIIAFAKRIKEGDKDLIENLKYFNIPDEDIKKMTDPIFIVDYFTKHIERDMRTSGFSIDWRRKFVSTEPIFSKFVEWQFGILSKNNLLTKGRHPVGWCPNENNPVGMHDTKHDVEPNIENEIAIKFKVVGEDVYFPCSTYRPETIFGVTNIFINENAEYVKCKLNDELYYISKKAAEILSNQFRIEIINDVKPSELLAKKCINPINMEELPVFPGFFVKEDIGTGVVMSVPSHAPFDYAALERLRAKGYPIQDLKIRKLINVEIGRSLADVAVGESKPIHQDIPALAYLEILHTDINAIDDMLEFATKLEYREESHWGKMIVKGYEGMSKPDAAAKVRAELLQKGNAFEIYLLANAPVYCRCGARVVVKVVEDQWFLNYGDKKWKELAWEAYKGVNIIPDRAKAAFEYTLNWLDLRAVARAQGLGTRLPLDKNYIIESLSDSTIYPAFYTISHILREKNISPEQLKPEFFEYIFRGSGDIEKIASSTGIDYETIKRCGESFAYWYKFTSRHSAVELVFNHLTMYIFNHAIIFDKQYWPKQIVVTGMVLSEGEKMSKSLGNTVPVAAGAEKYGIDTLRLEVNGGSDLLSDFNFTDKDAKGITERLEYLYEIVSKIDKYEGKELKSIDFWLYSKMSEKIKTATEAMEKLELRTAITSIFYDSIKELKRYFERGGDNSISIRDYIQSVILMLQPVSPHIAEEMWHMIGNTGFVSLEKWPSNNEALINHKIEKLEDEIDSFIEDAKNAIKLFERKAGKPSKIEIIIASKVKRDIYNKLAETKDPVKVISEENNKELAGKFVAKMIKQLNSMERIDISEDEELKSFVEAVGYIESKLGLKTTVSSESETKSQRAGNAMPLKPAIDLSR
ncbi:MAG: leucine--tRNA ligase [Candidatus Micrarchaeia archaeon]